MDLHNKLVLITGATGGIGEKLVAFLANEWADLVLVAKDTKKLKALTKNIHGHHIIIAADLSSSKGRNRLIKNLKRRKLKIDILINGAGIGIYKPALAISEKDWNLSYELNVYTPFFLWKELNPALTVNIGSCSALQHKANRALYNSTKAALRSITLCLEKEHPGELIHITLDSTLTSFGSLPLAEKKSLAKEGKIYLDPTWVAKQITEIVRDENRDGEYVLSPDCYQGCGTWTKP